LLAAAVAQVLGQHDSANGIEALTGRLVDLLFDQGELSDELIVAAAMEGEMTFVAQAIARKSGLRADIAMDELLSGNDSRVMAVLRIADLRRESVASLLAGIGDLLSIGDPGRAITTFDKLGDAEVESARRWLNADPAYRAAVGTLGDR